MHRGPLYLLLTALCVSPVLHAEEAQPLALNPVSSTPSATSSTPSNDSAVQINALQQQLAESQRQLSEQQSASGERETAQIARLRQENQRLKLQLKQAQAGQPPRLLTDQQLWFAIGAGTALAAFVIGRLSAGGRSRRRSEWA
ncbi:translation initiation factor 2 [Pseudomonas sp. PDM16]|uniref:translation initiation factor 2 n=1 Tax=Pseudomonas sp. PDM16 TaxID=2769292 RepID=UPI00177CD2F8|nr:translation initiation factor 2 [Pseudomonas sp. PDM16]MBD9414739.1 translation initiation factor 2 [Pseudomonas sp. PDM16]